MKVTRPVLRYYGGKFRLAPWIIAMMPSHRFYVEPFGGSAAVLMQKKRSYGEIYNDLDAEIVNVFRVLRDPGSAPQLREQLKLTPFSREEFCTAYQPSEDPIEQARRTVIKSFMGFGAEAIFRGRPEEIQMRTAPSSWSAPTGMRTSRKRGTTPATDWSRFPKTLDQFTHRLAGVVIENRDACEVMRTHDGEDTLHYVDPPYVRSSRSGSHGYRYELNDEDHRNLAVALHGLRGMVMLSGYPSALYDELYRDWTRFETPHLAQGAIRRTEVMWMNPLAVASLPAPSLNLNFDREHSEVQA